MDLYLGFLLQIYSPRVVGTFAALIVVEKHAGGQELVIQRKFLKRVKTREWFFLFEEFQWLMILRYFALIYFSWHFTLFFNARFTRDECQRLQLVDFFTLFLFSGFFNDFLLCRSLPFFDHKQWLGFRLIELFILNFHRFFSLKARSFGVLEHGDFGSFNGA